MPTWLHAPFRPSGTTARRFIALNLAFYGFFGLCMLVAAFLPDLQADSLAASDPMFPHPEQLRLAGTRL